MSSTYTVALSDLLDDMNMDDIADVDDLQNALDDLEDAALQLVSGSDTLADGAGTLADGVNSYTDGVDTFIEIGPGRTLTGFLKKINKDVTGLHIERVEDLDAVVKMLDEKQ